MLAQNEIRHPVRPAISLLSLIDLSAWIAGASFCSGIYFASAATTRPEPRLDSAGPYILMAAVAAFFLSVLLIQRHMRLSLRASTFGKPAHLVTSGIFRVSRNPIYVAFLVPLAALAYYSLSASIAAIALYVFAMNHTVIRKEERELLAAFGAEYESYSASVPRWLV